jgi:hemoglobin/transferrin/lactoferrin receptor protein
MRIDHLPTAAVRTPAIHLAAIALLAMGAAVAGAVPAREGAKAPGVADTVTVLKTFTVEGERSLTADRHAATSVRMDRSRLARFQPSTTADALLAAPGVDVSRTGPWASRVALRGLSGERVLVLVDGLRLQSGRGHGAQTSLVAVERLESVEILPGSGGAQFGSDALAGVVELSTHRSLIGERRASLLLTGRSGGPGNERSALARLRLVGPRLGGEFSAGLGGLDALVTPDGRVPRSGFHEDDYAARLQGRLGASLLDFERTHHAARDVQLPAFQDAAGSYAEYPLQARGSTRLEWSLPGTRTRPEMRLLAAQQRFRTDFTESVTDSTFLRGRFVARRTTVADDRISTRVRSLQPTLRRGATRVYGEVRRETTRGPRATEVTVSNAAGVITSSTHETGESIPPAQRDVMAAGAFTSAVWRGARLELGLRYDHLHSVADSVPGAFTSRLDVTDQRGSFEAGLSRGLGAITPYARAASGFRAPNLEERFFNDDIHGGMRLFGNPDLRAERTQTVELGVRLGELAGGRITGARVSAYRSEVTDLISLVYLGQLYLIPRFQYTNVRRAQLDGLEMQVEGALGGTRVTANAAFPRGRDLSDGSPIADLGAARATIDLRLPAGRVLPSGALSLRARWTDATGGDDPTLARPAFWTASLEGSCVVHQTRLAVTVKNLTATRYREPMSFIPEPGRSLMVSARRELDLPW